MDSLCRFVVCGLLYRLIVIICLLTSLNECGSTEGMSGSAQIEDASDVTWAHAVNSRDELEKALASSVDFLEADISLGHVKGSEDTPLIPVMAHPPSKTSDISLDTWLETVATRGSEKGLKLDFKSIEVVEPSLKILQKYASKLNGFLWLSADVLSGPVLAKRIPVQADRFLSLCKNYFPRAALSLGWTTDWFRRFPINTWKYEWKHVRKMADVVRCWVGDNRPPISFSVRAIFASRSIRQLQWLLDALPQSTLTVWSEEGDRVDEEDFNRIQKGFPKEKLHYKTAGSLKFHQKVKNSVTLKKKNVLDDDWLTITRELGDSCESFTYSHDNEVMFGRSSNILVLQRRLLLVNSLNNLTITGQLNFFAGEDTLNPTHWEHKLKIVLADISKIRKSAISYSKKKLAFTIRDTEAVWSTINSSVLYNYDHQYFNDNSACRMFKLELNTNLNFDAWTIPCGGTYEDSRSEMLSESGILEASLEERLDKTEKIFLLGFYSYGEEFVLLHNLDIKGQDETSKPVLNLPKQQLALTSSKDVLTHNFFALLLLILISFFLS